VLHFELSEVRAEAGCLEAALEFTDFADIAQTRETQVEAFGARLFSGTCGWRGHRQAAELKRQRFRDRGEGAWRFVPAPAGR
jgi:hypothetical protein